MSEATSANQAQAASQQPAANHRPARLIIAIVKPFRLQAVLQALRDAPVTDLSYQEARGYGRQKGHLEAYRGDIEIEFIPKIRIELRTSDANCQDVVGRVIGAAQTGRIGDGKIFVFADVTTLDAAAV
ncbi:MAG: P-II family nitrogen regulator [Planctomycetota bacterium]